MLFRQADPEIEAQRLRYFLAEEAPQRLTGDPAHDLSNNPSERKTMIPVHAASPPPGFRFLQHTDHQVPIPECSWWHGLAHRCDTGLVIEQHTHRNPLFTGLAKLRPVVRYRRIEVK